MATSRQIKVIIMLFTVLTIVVVALYINSFHIVKTDPSTKNITTASSSMEIFFNKPITLTGLQVSSLPDNIGSFKLIQPKVLKVTWASPLAANTKYLVKLIGIHLANGKVYNKSLVFKPKVMNFDNLSDSQKSALINSQDNNQPADNIYKILPHYESSYKLEAKPSGNNTPQIVFTYLPPPPDLINSSPDKPAALNLARQWLTGQGISLQKYQLIDYDTGKPI